MTDRTVVLADGRTVGYAELATSDGSAVLWCHGGPGCRLEPMFLEPDAAAAGLRIVGIDRPGYGLSDVQIGRSIAGWVDDALAVAADAGVDRFVTVGTSTGGAYALALAALVHERVVGVVVAGAMTDMRHAPARATMSRPHALDVWDAPTREAALAAAVASHGAHGEKLLGGGMNAVLAPRDGELFRDPAFIAASRAGWPSMFAHGLEGYTDDRRADGGGWTGFNVCEIRAPIVVLHGGRDGLVPPLHAEHTAELVPGARLVVEPDDGHFSILWRVVPTILELVRPR